MALEEDIRTLNSPVTLLGGGIENRNYRLAVTVRGRLREMVLRLPPERIPDWRKPDGPDHPGDPYDLAREFGILREIAPFHLMSPKAYGYDPDGRFFGVPCFLMDLLPGTHLSECFYPDHDPRHPRCAVDLIDQYARSIQAITEAPWASSAWLANNLPRWALKRMLAMTRWVTRAHGSDPLREEALQYLEARLPAAGPWRLHHGDPNPSNFLVATDSVEAAPAITAIVDWEFACLVDHPLATLEIFCGGYYGPLLGAGLWDAYWAAAGDLPIADLDWFLVRGLTHDVFGGGGSPDVVKQKALAARLRSPGLTFPSIRP